MRRKQEELTKKVEEIRAKKKNITIPNGKQKESKGLKKSTKAHNHTTHFGIGFS